MNDAIVSLGYLIIGKEATAGTAVTPTIAVPYYEETMDTMQNFVKLNPVMGNKFATQQTIPGMRSHGGEITVLCEGNTMGHFMNAFYVKGSTTGSNPYTTPFSIGTAQTGSYTFDISIGNNLVKRFFGCKISKIAGTWNANELQAKLTVGALGSFTSRELASVSTTTIVLKTDYDLAPSTGLVAADLVRLYDPATGNTLDTTVSSLNADGKTIVLGASAAAFAAGCMIFLRSATPVYVNLAPFTWTDTYFGFGADAATALTNATATLQTHVDQGSTWALTHDFNKKEGEQRSGSRDPIKFIRTHADAELTIKKAFVGPEDIRNFNSNAKSACVIRHLAGSSLQYELRLTFHHLTTDTPLPKGKEGEVEYSELKYIPSQDATDGAAVDTTVIAALSSL